MDVQTQQLSSAIQKLMSNGINNLKVQERYIMTPHKRPQICDISYSGIIPVIDLKHLNNLNKTTVVHEIGRACEEDGFFQVHTPQSLPNSYSYVYQACNGGLVQG